MPVVVRYKVTGLAHAMKAIGDIQHYVESDNGQQELAQAGLRGAATLFDKNFLSEGSYVGGWASLSDRTIEERLRLGFKEGPILIRHGDLREITATSLMTASGAGTFTKTDGQGKTIVVTIEEAGSRLNVIAGGDKAYNQVPTSQGNPARPYWFANSGVLAALKASSVDKLAEAIGRFI